MRHSMGTTIVVTIVAAGVFAAASGTAAQGYDRKRGAAASPYVVAESNYGKGSVTGAVREGHRGVLQVQMPNGSWIDCVRSCSETLRRATVDFWESNGAQAKDQGPGYFTWSFGRRY